MVWIKLETRERLSFPPLNLDGSIVDGFIEKPNDYEFPTLPEPPPQPNLQGFNESQVDTLTKIFLEGNKTEPLRISWLQEAWRSGDFDKAIALWNFLAPSFIEVVTEQEIAAFQSDLVTYNLPLSLSPTTLEMTLVNQS